MSLLAIASAVVIAATAMIHSIRGEQRMIGPLLASGALAATPRTGRAIRFTWHLAALLMFLTALTVAWPGTPPALVLMIAATYLGLGAVALYLTKGRHVSGPMFTASGLLALLSAFAEAARP